MGGGGSALLNHTSDQSLTGIVKQADLVNVGENRDGELGGGVVINTSFLTFSLRRLEGLMFDRRPS